MRLKLTLAYVLVLLFGGILLSPKVLAANFDFEVDTTYVLNVDKTVNVSTSVKVINNVSTRTQNKFIVPAPGNNVDNINAFYANGDSISSAYNADQSTIQIDLPSDSSGSGNTWAFTYSYDANLGSQLGKTFIFQVPLVDYENMNIVRHSISVEADLGLGVGVSRGFKPTDTDIAAGAQVLTWENSSERINKAISLVFGESSLANLKIDTSLSNSTWWWQTKTITLPPDTNQQHIFIDDIQPRPSSISLDIDGNILASYNLRPRQSLDISITARAVISNFAYSLDSVGELSSVPAEIQDNYIGLTEAWKADKNDINEATVVKTIQALQQEIAQATRPLNEKNTALEAAEQRSNMLIGALRSRKVPSRLVLGLAYGDGSKLLNEAVPHAWVEAYLPNVGWITLDPSYQINGDYFGYTDVQRVALALRGIDDSEPAINLDHATVEFVDQDTPETPAMEPIIKATKYMLLPGIALQSIDVTLPSGIIVDGAGVEIDDALHVLGSLAPLQSASVRSLALGAGAFSSTSVQYGVISGGSLTASGEEVVTVISYVPLISLVTLMLLILVAYFVIKKVKSRRSSNSKTKKAKRTSTKDSAVYATEDDGSEIERANLMPEMQTAKEENVTMVTTEPEVTEAQPKEEPDDKKEEPEQAQFKKAESSSEVVYKSHERPRRKRNLIQ